MAKQEVDLKKVELKVSVDCCDGCKKKVKKALNSIQGVLKTEIDPLQPKVTIQGNVDTETLINKLQIKAGKQAQLWTYDNHDNSTTETKEISTTTTVKIEHEISKSKHLEDPQESHAENAANTADGGSSCKRALKNNDHDEDTNKNENPLPHHHLLKNNDHDEDTNKNENPLPHHHLQTNSLRRLSTSKARTRSQYCYAVQPCTITLPHYAVHSYRMPPPLTSEQSYNQEQYYYETPVFQPSIPTPSTRVEDYFSDENTVGCYVM